MEKRGNWNPNLAVAKEYTTEGNNTIDITVATVTSANITD